MKSYTLTDLEERLEEWWGDSNVSSWGEGEIAQKFLDWLRKVEEIDELLEMAEDDEPIDLLGAAGVPGVATKREIMDLDSTFLVGEPLDAEEQAERDDE